MIVSAAAHQAIVDLLKERIAELQQERDFYRRAYLERLGQRFPEMPTAAQATAVVTLGEPARELSDVERRKTFRLDRSDWTDDDREFFRDYWENPARERQIPDDEIDYWYHERYGNKLPLAAFVEAAYST